MDTLISSNRDAIVQQILLTSRIDTVAYGIENFTINLLDGRIIVVPYYWFPRLFAATLEQREQYILHGKQTIIVWQALNEAVSVEMLLFGIPDQTFASRTWRKEHGYAFVDENMLAQAA
jgi:Protein of unknown function (DUF2442)